MDLNLIYDGMLAESLNSIKGNKLALDNLIDDKTDDRRGLTLLIRPSDAVRNAISTILNEFRLIEPEQYYYTINDMHITVMSIISCRSGFKLESINPEFYNKVIQKSLNEIEPFFINMKGVTMSNSGLVIKGFPIDSNLEQLRDNLRLNFAHSELESTLDVRYKIKTAHSTVLRFKKPLRNTEKFLQLFEKYQKFDFGTFEVNNYEFVFSDWYQRTAQTILLKTF